MFLTLLIECVCVYSRMFSSKELTLSNDIAQCIQTKMKRDDDGGNRERKKRIFGISVMFEIGLVLVKNSER